MRMLDVRLTLFGLTIFFRLLCQYPNVFYWFMLSATAPGVDLFSLAVTSTRKAPIGFKDLFKFLSFRRWKLIPNPRRAS